MANQSPLIDFHRAHGAQIRAHDDRLMPLHFGNAAAEYAAVRSKVGLIDLSSRGLLQFTGPDRLSFLQGMLSNDLRTLNTFDGQTAALLTQQGKVIADVRVLCAMNSFYLDFWTELKDAITTHLNRFLVADEVEIADRSDEYTTLSVQGPRSTDLLRAWTADQQLPEQSKQHAMARIDGAAVCVVRDSQVGETGYDLIIPDANLVEVAQKLTDLGKQFSAVWVGTEAENVLRVEAGTPRYGIDFDHNNLLLEVGLDGAVSFSKGCYLGQEVVERIRSRGHVNKKLCGLLLDGQAPVDSGAALVSDGKDVGKVTSSVFSPGLRSPVALGYVAKEHWKPGTVLGLGSSGSLIKAIVTELPFVRSS